MKKLFLGCVLLFCGACRLVADTVPFALYDIDGNVSCGQLQELTAEKIVLRMEDGEKNEWTTKTVARLESLSHNPFTSKESTPEKSESVMAFWGRLGGRRIPAAVPSPPSSRTVASLLQKKEAETKAGVEKNVFPNNVIVVDLTDGSRLLAAGLTAKGKTAVLRLFPQGEATLPLDRFVAVRLAVATPSQVSDPPADWSKLLTKSTPKGDRLVVGTAGSFDAHEGILNEISDETIRFAVDGDTLPIPRRKVFGIIFHQPEPPKPNRPLCRLVGWNGTSLVLNSLELRDLLPEEGGTVFVWKTLDGVEGELRMEDVAEIVFEATGVVSLSELTPSGIEQSLPFGWAKQPQSNASAGVSPLEQFLRFQANRLLQDGESLPLDPILEQIVKRRLPGDRRTAKIAELPIPDFHGIELEGTVYRQGLVVPAQTTLIFPLKESYKTFTAKVGIDDRLRPDGQVRLTVLGDELLLLDTFVYGDEPTRTIHLDIERCRKLTISVDLVNGDSKAAVLSLAELKIRGE